VSRTRMTFLSLVCRPTKDLPRFVPTSSERRHAKGYVRMPIRRYLPRRSVSPGRSAEAPGCPIARRVRRPLPRDTDASEHVDDVRSSKGTGRADRDFFVYPRMRRRAIRNLPTTDRARCPEHSTAVAGIVHHHPDGANEKPMEGVVFGIGNTGLETQVDGTRLVAPVPVLSASRRRRAMTWRGGTGTP
jgi:hypothetical protein